MPGASIVADQLTGAGAGTPSVSRNDLWLDQEIALSCSIGGNASFIWELLDVPPGSAVALSVTTPTAAFTPDIPGTYRLQLTTNGGGAGNVQILALRVRFDNVGNIVNNGRVLPAFEETSAEDNAGGNVRGWAPVLEYNEEDTQTRLAAVEAAATGLFFRADYGTDQNLTLSGSQSVDGAVRSNGDVILAMGQNDLTENGPYIFNSGGAWVRAPYFNESAEVVQGLLIEILPGGTSFGRTFWSLVTEDPIALGVSEIEFERVFETLFGLAGSITTVNAADAANAGVEAFSARIDHQHAVATAAPSGGIGASNVEGVSTGLARADHQHQLTAANVSTAANVGNDKAVVSNGSGVLQGCTVSDGQVLAHAGGAFLGVGYTATPTTGSLSLYLTSDGTAGSLKAAAFVVDGANPATIGDLRLPATSSIRYGASSRYALSTSEAGGVFLGQIEKPLAGEGSTITWASDDTLDLIAAGDVSVSGQTVSVVGGAGATVETTTGNLVLAASEAAALAELSAGTGASLAKVELNASTGFFTLTVGGTARVFVSSTVLEIGVPTVTFSKTVASPVIQQSDQTTDTACNDLVIQSQGPWPSASTNKNPGRLVLRVKSPVAGGTVQPIALQVDGSTDRHLVYRNGLEVATHATKQFWVGAFNDNPTSGYAGLHACNKASLSTTNYALLTNGGTETYIGVPTSGGLAYFTVAGSIVATLGYVSGVSQLKLSVTDPSIPGAIVVAPRTSDALAQNLTLEPGGAYASATTDANKAGGDLVEQLHAPTNSGTVFARESLQWGTSNPPTWDRTVRQKQTTNATPVDVDVTIPDSATTAYDIVIVARRPSNGDAGTYFWRAGADRHSGTAALLGANEERAYEDAGATAGGWTTAITVSSPSVRITLTGETGATINWDIFLQPRYRVS